MVLSPGIALADFQVDLHYGSKGDDVIALQEFLTDQGVYSGVISGNFYSLTARAVKKFQALKNIIPTSGYFGPLTRSIANGILVDVAPVSEENATITPAIAEPIQVIPQVNAPIMGATTQTTVAPAVPQCIENPVLTLKKLPNREGRVNFFAEYSTGCPLDVHTKWSYTDQVGTNSEEISDKSNIWYLENKIENNVFYLRLYDENEQVPFSLTVGSTTKNI